MVDAAAVVVLDVPGLQDLGDLLAGRGFTVRGPTVPPTSQNQASIDLTVEQR